MKINIFESTGYDSKILFNEMILQQSDTLNKMQLGLNWIKENNINCVLVGGTAVAHYLNVKRSLTPDLDFLINDFTLLKTELLNQSLKFEKLIDVNGDSNFGITVNSFNVDFLNINSGHKAIKNYAFKTAKNGNIAGANLKIISPSVLVIMKLTLGREKDDIDAFALLKSGMVNKIEYLDDLQILKPHIDYITLQGYSKLI